MSHSVGKKFGQENRITFHTAHCVVSWLDFYIIANSRQEIVHLSFSCESLDKACEKICRLVSGALIVEDRALLERMVLVANQFLQCEFTRWPVATSSLLVDAGTQFQQQVWKAIAAIGFGDTETYGGLAAGADSPDAARAVGGACNANPLALIIPCHRVVGRGSLGGFAGGLDMKRNLLALENSCKTKN